MSLKLIAKKGLYKYRQNEERWLGKQIIKNSAHASPDFMVIGTPKSGTTSLYQYLGQHPDILLPNEKELFYFSGNQKKRLAWYLNQFPEKAATENKLTFEATPTYFYYRRGIKRISELFPTIKLILILRDPVKRAYSHWNFKREKAPYIKRHPERAEKRSFDRAVREEIENGLNAAHHYQYIERSLYATHLEMVYEYFPKNQVLVLDSTELKNNRKIFMNRLVQFLELKNVYGNFSVSEESESGILSKKDDQADSKLKVYNVNHYTRKLPAQTEKYLRGFFAPHNKKLRNLTGKTFSWM